MKIKKKRRLKPWVVKTLYAIAVLVVALGVMWPKPEPGVATDTTEVVETAEEEPAPQVVIEELVEPEPEPEPVYNSYPANRMTHYVMDGNDAGTCIAGRWCIGNQLSVAEDTSVRYQGYYVYAVHCSVVSEWRGSLIKVYYTDGGVETGIVLDCGGFAGHKDRMDKAMGTRYNGKQDNYTLSRYIERTEVVRKGW